MAKFGREIGLTKTYLPDIGTLLVCLLAVGTVLRGIAASKPGLCNDKDKDGTIGWIAFAVATVVVTVEKWFSTKNFGTTIVALISYVLIQLSLHTAPIKCVVDNSRKSDSNAIEIVQTCCGALFFLLYLIIILHKKL